MESDSESLRFEYLWQDSESFKKPTRLPAPEYVEHLMSWVQSNIDNESMFPSKIGSFTRWQCCTAWLTDHRCSIPKDVPAIDQTNLQETIPGLRTYLLSPLSCHYSTWSRTTSKYQLQALRLVCGRTWTSNWQRFLGSNE